MTENAASRRLVIRVLASVTVSTVAAAGLVVWTLTRPVPDAGVDRVRVSQAATPAPIPAVTPPPGTRAAPLALPALDGGTVELAELRGRPVVVNFWAPDCLPCREEFPLLRAAYAQHAAAGLEIIGVTIRGSAADARAFAADHGATWPLVMDDGQRVAARYQVAGIPQTFFVRPDGTIASHQLGALDAAALDRQLAAILPAG